VDFTEITAVQSGLRARFQGRLARPVSPPSLRALIALLLSAFLLGGVLAALLFVGVWRHTAAEGDRARSAQIQSKQALRATQLQLTAAQHDVDVARASLAKLRAERRQLGRELNRRRAVDGRLARSLPPQLQSISANAGTIEQKTAKLATALTTLRDYLRNASATGVDPAFLGAQVGYLIGSANATRATASQLAADSQSAQASASSLHSKR
jgi:hypothetical protein